MAPISNEPTFIAINPRHDVKGTIDIVWQFKTFQKKECDRISCYIPGFNIYFTAKDKEMIDKKSIAMTRMYIDHFLEYPNEKKGIERLVLHLHKSGFKTTNDVFTIKKIVKDHVLDKTKFKSSSFNIPEHFIDAEVNSHETEMEIAL